MVEINPKDKCKYPSPDATIEYSIGTSECIEIFQVIEIYGIYDNNNVKNKKHGRNRINDAILR